MQMLLTVAVILLAGLMMSRLAKKCRLPAVTAYIITGIIMGPYLIGALKIPGVGFHNAEALKSFDIITQAATGFIAFSIGNEFRLSALKKTGKQATVIGILQALAATLAVDAALVALHFAFPDKISLASAITLGAIAAATAPATTMMVVNQYKAKGPVTDLLLPIVALDDAVGLVVFAVSFGVAKSLTSGVIDILTVVVEPLLEVAASLALGFVVGILFTAVEKVFHSRSKRMSMSIAFVLLTVAVSSMKIKLGAVVLGFSPLLACMMLGSVFCNMCEVSEELMDRTDRWTAPLYIMFFAVSGAQLDFSVFLDPAVVAVGLVFVVFRCLGKYFGARFSAKSVGFPDTVVKFLGVTLFPQEGVALGMTATALSLGSDGTYIRNIVLFAVLIYELCGPLATKIALTNAGEISPEGKKSSRGAADMAGGRR